jgi:CubicO group peptidase (beta-lactamase class C family)
MDFSRVRMVCLFKRVWGLLSGIVVLGACAGENAGQEHYKYGVASWQGVNTAAPAYRHAIAKSRRLIAEATRHNGLPGAQIAVAIDGKVCWSENFGYADLGQGRVVQPNTLFRMASVSKMYTAAAVARLVQEHKLDLDTPVVSYLPELPGHYAGITTRHLVSHQAGHPALLRGRHAGKNRALRGRQRCPGRFHLEPPCCFHPVRTGRTQRTDGYC